MVKEDKKSLKKVEKKEELKKEKEVKVEEKVVKKKSINKRKKYERIVMISIGVLLFATLCFILGSGYGSMYTFNVLYKDKNTNLDGEGYIIDLYKKEFEYGNDEDSIKRMINITDHFTPDSIRYGMLDSDEFYNDVDDFKIAYVLNEIFYYEGNGVKYFTTEYLDKAIEKVFSEGVGLSENDLNPYIRHLEILANDINIICDNKICTANGIPGGGAGDNHYVTEIVATRKDGGNTIYTLKEYYVEFVWGNNGIEACNISNVKKGKNLYKGDCLDSYEELATKIDVNELNTYEMTFDKDYKYVSSKKVK